jgi:DNA-binding phage protein
VKVSDLAVFDAAAYLDGPEAVAAYLVAASEGGDPDRIAAAVNVVLRVRAARTEAGRMVISDEDYAAASVRGAAEQACVPVIAWASYDAGRHELVIEFVNGMKLTTPVAILQELHEAPVEALGEIEVEGGGMVLRWPRLDVSLWVPALLVGVTGTRAWMAAH